ncbi:MAG TPA: sigma-70 family RNA polymerase sigma factor [Ignavibacteriaceae bacterium]|jgi:RNA polymerase sigma-70 factor (ECF subfamily)
MKGFSDQEVIESVKKGNHSDYAILIDRYKNKAFSMLTRMLKNRMEAEEVLQDCFLKAFKGLNTFKGESKFSTWFYKIVYNSALSRLSIQKRKTEMEMSSVDDHFDLISENDFNLTEQNDLSLYIKEMVNKLPANYASVISMFYLENLSCEEISEVMGTTVNNVKVMLHRSRSALKDILIKNKYREELL